MKIKKIELPTDGVPKLIRGPIAEFMTIEESRGRVWLFVMEDEDNKPVRSYYFASFASEMNDPVKWDYYKSVKFNGRVLHYFIMQG